MTAPAMVYTDGVRALRSSMAAIAQDVFQPPPRLSVSEWADENRRLPSTGAIPGRFRTDRLPYMRRIQDVLGDNTTQEVYFAKSSQVAGSTVGENFIGYLIDLSPCAILMVWPTESKLKKWSKKRLDPMLQDTASLRAKFPRSGRREAGDTIAYKDFPGGWLNAITAKSTTELKSDTARVAIAEEVDEWEYDLDAQGDPLDLLLVRLRTFFNRKLYVPSTPTIAGASKIWSLLEQSTWEEFWVPCPHCHEMQVLRWRDESADGVEVGQYRFVFERDEHGEVIDGSTQYVCEHCACTIDESHKQSMLERGEWRARNPNRKAVGFHIWTAYSPLVKWDEIAREFLKSRHLASKLKVFVNTWLGLPFKDDVESIGSNTLSARAVKYPKRGDELLLPHGVGVLTCSIDVQGGHGGWLDLLLWGWGAGEKSWVYRWEQLEGDPGHEAVWIRAREMLLDSYPHESGARLRVSATCVDAGYQTDKAWNFARKLARYKVIATVGRDGRGRKLIEAPDLTRLRRTTSRKKPMHIIGVDSGKDLLSSRLRLKEPELPGYITIPDNIDPMFYEQITAEELRTEYRKGRPLRVWHLPDGKRNEALDGAVMNMAALHYLGAKVINSLGALAQAVSKTRGGGEGAAVANGSGRPRGRRQISGGIE
jgi:phage terminase large subunit GpA-like protein